ncbi:sulfotransferase domain-containing protein [Limnofasciculus baicalensis]|uniref:Sulfotransferase domain-containing protein n=1 Tax=Limnofasciculus baicalensis BBK-W-15 TaxID=2699891 RepID=A0AAE3KM90_9CYAN|nr:sulfotransferase domain-containing protein [Limnofasciculus baicalensis]MCP2727423.1 sulfotransferase domain-containing protein [Limnofasciculus baicalensis BBK-W-15]
MIKQLIKKIAYPMIKSRPDFLIIGTQKGGSTSLYRYLSQHRQIFKNNSWKEIQYFDRTDNYSKGFGWYLGNFPSKVDKQDKLTCDASPSYIYFENIPKLIKQDLGEIKMIAILRNPVSRAYSAWHMYHSFGDNPHKHLREITDPRDFADAINQELDGNFQNVKYPYDYINRGEYVNQLENYYNYFNKDSLLVLNFDLFKQDLDGMLNSVCDFLNIERFDRAVLDEFKIKKHNVGKYDKSTADEEVMEPLKDYFNPFNEKLYHLLGERYNW